MSNHLLYFGYWLVNSLLLFIASLVLPESVMKLGSWRFNSLESSLYAGFCITFLIWVWWDFALAHKFTLDNKMFAFAFFVFVNSFSILAVSTFSYFTGVEVISYIWIVIIGLVVTILQRVTRSFIVGKRPSTEAV